MIVIRLDRILADRKKKLSELANEIDITVANLSNLKTGKAKAIRFSTLDAICKALDCQPADIIEYTESEE
ncbi:transcriptional regulator [Staphylococcus cohnii]|uniref:helix-turn-helix domain-containing protein n=1 Tax=Staphylococcus cohnii TaxID=29382 RepID=UPI000F7BC4A9|nr:helix-turn-helix transcriptional regulator [Staphylococcus cohnii]AYX91000.1 transcriptional regulator [Staphylococcus cohnii]